MRVTHMRVYAGSSPTGANHRKELISALFCSLNDVKYMNGKKNHQIQGHMLKQSVFQSQQSMQQWTVCTLYNQSTTARGPQSSHCAKKATIHQVTTMLTTSKNVLFPGHNHLLTTGTDKPFTRWCSDDNQIVRSSAPVVSTWL